MEAVAPLFGRTRKKCFARFYIGACATLMLGSLDEDLAQLSAIRSVQGRLAEVIRTELRTSLLLECLCRNLNNRRPATLLSEARRSVEDE